jgi:hypothetical protein
MDTQTVLEDAATAGFSLQESYVARQDVWAWRRGDDLRHPCFLSEREAVSWTADRLRRIAVFE